MSLLLALCCLGVIATQSLVSMATPSPLLGPVFPPPTNLSRISQISETSNKLREKLVNDLLSGLSPFGNFTSNATSVSITAISTSQQDPIFDFHFTSPLLKNGTEGTSSVDSDSIYRIGSVSKLLTVYSLLLNGAEDHWNCPVTEFIPELKDIAEGETSEDLDEVTDVMWEEIAIGALASQLSDIGNDYNLADLASQPIPVAQFGLPSLSQSEIPTCGGNESLPPCSRREYFQGLPKRPPVFSPYTTPVYSNTAYRILGYVLEAISGTSYEDTLRRSVLEPLNMNRTTASIPSNSSWGVIPPGDSLWSEDLGDEVPTGGIFSTSADLSSFARAILTSNQLSPLQTRRWLKPVSHTSSLTASVGAPWEIWRTRSNITTGHVIDLYTKSGSIGAYGSLLILIPEYNVAVTILTAGPAEGVVNFVADIVVQAFLPVLDAAAKAQALQKFGGTYVSGTNVNSSLTLGVDSGPGLLVEKWISNGVDFLAAGQAYSDATGGGEVKSVRLYPTNLSSPSNPGQSSWLTSTEDGKDNTMTMSITKLAFRAIFEVINEEGSVPRIFDTDASTWGAVDQLTYGNLGVDEFVFSIRGGVDDGEVVAVEPMALRIALQKVP